MQNISEIEELIKLISKLPGLGPKSAKRIVLKLINNRDELVKPMANTLAQVYKNVVRCNSCGALKSNSVKITLDGEGEMQTIKLSDEIMKEEKTIIEDLIVAAHNSAKSQLKSKTTEEISKATGGFGIPGFKWPL